MKSGCKRKDWRINCMKKLISVMIAMVFVISLAGCGAQDNSLGGMLKADFESQIKANENVTAQELADKMCANEKIPFEMLSAKVEEGTLMGFDNADIQGFSEGVMFSPIVGSVPFIGYVFVLDEDTDVEEFMNLLLSNANPRWNICTEAEETVVTHVGNKVLFLMSPKDTDLV